MQTLLSRRLLCATIAAAFLTACAGSGNGSVPNTASSLGAPQGFGQDAGSAVLSGEYTGTFRASHYRTKAILFLSQSQSTLGGTVFTSASPGGLGIAIAWVVNGKTISGNAVEPFPSNGYCTLLMSGKYKNRKLTGTYTSTYGCSGGTVHFTFWHKCYYQGTGSETIRPETGIKPC